jgi:hypothetical protein
MGVLRETGEEAAEAGRVSVVSIRLHSHSNIFIGNPFNHQKDPNTWLLYRVSHLIIAWYYCADH